MSRWKIPAGAFALLAVGLGWYAGRERREIAGLRAGALAKSKEVEVLRRTAGQFQRAATRKRRAAARAAAPLDRQAAAARRRRSATFDLTPYLRKDPDYARLHRLQILRMVDQMYGSDNLKALGLPPDEVAKVRELLAERIEAPEDARQIALEQGIGPNSRDMGRAINDALSQVNADIEAMVGPDALKMLNQLQGEAGYRGQIQYQIAPDMNAAGVGLNPSQINALAQAELQAQTQAAQTMRITRSPVNVQQATTQALLAAAPQILAPDQLVAFQQSVSQYQEYQAMIARAMAAARKEVGHPITSWTVSGF